MKEEATVREIPPDEVSEGKGAGGAHPIILTGKKRDQCPSARITSTEGDQFPAAIVIATNEGFLN